MSKPSILNIRPENEGSTASKKSNLHARNKQRERYDFELLIKCCPELAEFVIENKYGDETIDFLVPAAVKALNKALLFHNYELSYWDIPEDHLCPPIPGRADYIHHVADVLARFNFGKIPRGEKVKCLDVGVGANCVYPIIGNGEYGWSFIGSDVDEVAIASANKIVESNHKLKGKIECRLQTDSSNTFKGILKTDERIDLAICNPPFHVSPDEPKVETTRKPGRMKKKNTSKAKFDLEATDSEQWTNGSEKAFILNMVDESVTYAKSCFWFSTLVTKRSTLKHIYKALDNLEAKDCKTIPMGLGTKSSRIVAWTFLNGREGKKWAAERWGE